MQNDILHSSSKLKMKGWFQSGSEQNYYWRLGIVDRMIYNRTYFELGLLNVQNYEI